MSSGSRALPSAVFALALGSLASCWMALDASAQEVPLPEWVRSVVVIDDGAVSYVAPDERSPRRGTVALGTQLPFLSRSSGAGCGDFRFVQVGPEVFLCERDLRFSPHAPSGVKQPVLPEGSLLPYEYLFVASDGATGYAHPADHATDDYVVYLRRGFTIAVAERLQHEGLSFVRSQRGYYLRAEALRGRPVSDFSGVPLSSIAELSEIAWVVRPGESKPASKNHKSALRTRLSLVRLSSDASGSQLTSREGETVQASELARPRPATPPAVLLPGERWLDIDTETQILTVYQGETPVFATLVSTGLPPHETPKGSFRIWVKLATSDMSDREREDEEPTYSIEHVPFVQYFHGSIGLHAAFWHDRFGEKRSHGCVNLSPRDARTVFELTSPALPDGYYAILPTEQDPGTRVVVR